MPFRRYGFRSDSRSLHSIIEAFRRITLERALAIDIGHSRLTILIWLPSYKSQLIPTSGELDGDWGQSGERRDRDRAEAADLDQVAVNRSAHVIVHVRHLPSIDYQDRRPRVDGRPRTDRLPVVSSWQPAKSLCRRPRFGLYDDLLGRARSGMRPGGGFPRHRADERVAMILAVMEDIRARGCHVPHARDAAGVSAP